MTTKEQVLQNCTVEGTVIKLPNTQLERKLYQEVAKSLELIGGKWKGGKTFGFVFETDPTDLLNQIANGEKRNLKKEYQFFATPKALAEKLVQLAEINPYDTILEPSAGQGAIIRAINEVSTQVVDCFELMDVNVEILLRSKLHFCIVGRDFMNRNLSSNQKYTKIIANPPFTKNQDIEHLLEMYSILDDKGTLVCVTSESWVDGSQAKQLQFKRWLKEVDAEVIDIPRGTFKESGTMVGGKIVVITKN